MYKEDIAQTTQRFRAFWEGEIIDRVCLAVKAPREEQVPLPQAESDEQFLTDPDFAIDRYNAEMSNTYYGGEAFPAAWALGQLMIAAYGGRAKYGSETVWVFPTIHSGDAWASYRFDHDNRFITDALRLTQALSLDGQGKYLVGSPGIVGPLDAMAQIRGLSDFLVELAMPEYEDVIRQAHRACLEGFRYIAEAVYQGAGLQHDGHINHPGLWAPGRINNWSADWSCLISPKHFRQWMMPELEEMARFLDYNMYHLDGPNAVRHLPMILEIDELKGIQYTPGAGHGLEEAMPVYKEIQSAGRVQWVSVAYEEVEVVLRELNPRGLLIFTNAPSVEAADALLKKAEGWSTTGHLRV